MPNHDCIRNYIKQGYSYYEAKEKCEGGVIIPLILTAVIIAGGIFIVKKISNRGVTN